MRTAIENRSEERVTRTLQNGNTIELSHFNRTERETVNIRIIETLKNHLNNERINRWSIFSSFSCRWDVDFLDIINLLLDSFLRV